MKRFKSINEIVLFVAHYKNEEKLRYIKHRFSNSLNTLIYISLLKGIS